MDQPSKYKSLTVPQLYQLFVMAGSSPWKWNAEYHDIVWLMWRNKSGSTKLPYIDVCIGCQKMMSDKEWKDRLTYYWKSHQYLQHIPLEPIIGELLSMFKRNGSAPDRDVPNRGIIIKELELDAAGTH